MFLKGMARLQITENWTLKQKKNFKFSIKGFELMNGTAENQFIGNVSSLKKLFTNNSSQSKLLTEATWILKFTT